MAEEDELSLHDAIENAIDEQETGGPEEGAEESMGVAAPEQGQEQGPAETADPVTAPAQEDAAAVAKAADAGQAGELDAPVQKAPQSWTPEAKVEWDKVPAPVKAEVERREREIQTTLNQTTEARKAAQAFEQVWKPYESLINADGSNPIKAAENLFRSAATLRMGSPAQKATMVAGLVQQYGIDLKSLDLALTAAVQGRAPQAQPAPQQPMHDPRVDMLLQQQSQQAAATATQEVEAFGQDKPYFDDVRDQMADLIEVVEKRGSSISLDDAYNRCIASNPAFYNAIQQKKAAAQTQTQSAATVRAKKAASSVKSHPAQGQATKSGSMTMRESIEAAIATTG